MYGIVVSDLNTSLSKFKIDLSVLLNEQCYENHLNQ